jgi:hypothetical protein
LFPLSTAAAAAATTTTLMSVMFSFTCPLQGQQTIQTKKLRRVNPENKDEKQSDMIKILR